MELKFMLNIIFWIMMALSMIAISLNFFCYQTLEIIVILLIFDFIALASMIIKEKEEKDNVRAYVMMKLDAIEKICNHTLQKVFTPETAKKLEREEKDIVKWLENF